MSWTKHYDYSSSVHLRSNEKWRRKEEYLLNEGTYGIEKWVPSRTGKAVEFHTAPKKWSLISSRQTHQPRNVQNVSKDYHLFLEKPSLKVFGKITHNFHPLRPLLPLFSVSCTSPELLAPLHHHLNTLKALLIGGEKPKSEAGPVFSPRPLQQQHYLLPHFPRETCWKRVCHAPSPSQASTLSHLAFALPAAQNQRSIKSPTTGWFSWHFDTADFGQPLPLRAYFLWQLWWPLIFLFSLCLIGRLVFLPCCTAVEAASNSVLTSPGPAPQSLSSSLPALWHAQGQLPFAHC